MKHLICTISVSLLFFLSGCSEPNNAKILPPTDTAVIDSAAVDLVTQAYLFGYPMMTMHYTHLVSTNVEANNGLGKAPLNQWGNMHKFPKAGFTSVVRPNVDTYYSVVYADLSDGPLYLHIPATERYYLMPILNAHGDVIESLGTRTSGQEALNLAFVGPGYTGDIDDDLTVIRSTTNLNWLIGRVAVKNDEDGESLVSGFQADLIARPLSERNNVDYSIPKGEINPNYIGAVPMDAVDGLDLVAYLNEVMQLMIDNPAYTEDAPLLTQLKTIGIEPGGDFDLSQFNASTQEAMINIPAGVQTAFDGMTASPPPGNLQNGWNVNTSGLGNYGTEYSVRAYVTKIGYGANQAVDAIYPNTAVDGDGQNLSGSHKYVLHFDAGSMPPVRGFWSLTMYDKRGFLVDNAIDRYNLGSMKELTYNSDGSLDLLIQSTPPTGNEANWLPSPPPGEEFELTFRMYYPEEVVIDREFVMPAVERVN